MSIIEQIVRVFAPHTCLGCGLEADRLLCEGCLTLVATVPSRCYRCRAVTEGYATCRDCRPRTSLSQVAVYAHHQGLMKEFIHRLKHERAQAGAREAAALLAPLLFDLPADALLVHVPTATSRVRLRGYDHARLMARELSRRSGRQHATLLGRQGQTHQVGARRAARLRQLEGAFRPLRKATIKGRHIVLIDDVLTTGATLETAARVLRRAGAARVSALLIAQA
jgi:ComF family protein